MYRNGRAAKGKNKGKRFKMNKQLFILRVNMKHVIKAAFFYMQDHDIFFKDFTKRYDILQGALRQQLLRFLSIATVDLNSLADSPWPYEINTCDNNDNANSNSIFQPCKVEYHDHKSAALLGSKVNVKHLRERVMM